MCVFSWFYTFFEPTKDGIMVANCHFIVNGSLIRFPIVGTEQVIDTYKHTAFMIRPSRTIPRRNVTVCQIPGYGLTDIRKGIVVKIATNND